MHLRAWLTGVLLGTGATAVESLGMKEIRRDEEWQAALAASEAGPVLLFKHSTTCPVSAAAYRQVAEYMKGADTVPGYMVKVIEARPVSNAIASELGVTHQSPQAIWLRGRRAVWNASHGSVTSAALRASQPVAE